MALRTALAGRGSTENGLLCSSRWCSGSVLLGTFPGCIQHKWKGSRRVLFECCLIPHDLLQRKPAAAGTCRFFVEAARSLSSTKLARRRRLRAATPWKLTPSGEETRESSPAIPASAIAIEIRLSVEGCCVALAFLLPEASRITAANSILVRLLTSVYMQATSFPVLCTPPCHGQDSSTGAHLLLATSMDALMSFKSSWQLAAMSQPGITLCLLGIL